MQSLRAALLGAIVLAAIAAAPSLRAAEEPSAAFPNWKKGEQEGTVSIDGKDERFVALVPSGYSAKKPCPAVLLLHGNGGKAADFLQSVRPHVGKSPLLLIALERCDVDRGHRLGKEDDAGDAEDRRREGRQEEVIG
jgi:poly(3-hydroxybutyrate) depolymerase